MKRSRARRSFSAQTPQAFRRDVLAAAFDYATRTHVTAPTKRRWPSAPVTPCGLSTATRRISRSRRRTICCSPRRSLARARRQVSARATADRVATRDRRRRGRVAPAPATTCTGSRAGRPLVTGRRHDPVRPRRGRSLRRRRRVPRHHRRDAAAPPALATSAASFRTPIRAGRARRASTCWRAPRRGRARRRLRDRQRGRHHHSRERRRSATYVDAMRDAVAGALGIDADRVSVKGKTNEGVDAVGRGEAIAAHAWRWCERVKWC